MCLIPEVPFALKGSKGLFAYVEKVLEEKGHCVMCIAEGAGQVSATSMLSGSLALLACLHRLSHSAKRDSKQIKQLSEPPCHPGLWCFAWLSPYRMLFAEPDVLQDILAAGNHDLDLSGNPILKDVGPWMRGELKAHFKEADIKYIDPSYMIRSTPTISADRIYCKVWLRSSTEPLCSRV